MTHTACLALVAFLVAGCLAPARKGECASHADCLNDEFCDAPSGPVGQCTALGQERCPQDWYVLDGECERCPPGTTNDPGDDNREENSFCEGMCSGLFGDGCANLRDALVLEPWSLIPSDEDFGAAVTGNARHLFVGSPKERTNGRVYVFDRTPADDAWERGYAIIEDAGTFGTDVLELDDAVVVGGSPSGLLIFERDGETWRQTSRLASIDARPLATDGSRAFLSDEGTQRVIVMERTDTGWSTTVLEGAELGAAGFRHALAAGDDTLFVGVPTATAPNTTRSGVVHVFRASEGSWVHHSTLTSPTPEEGDCFGWSLALDAGLLAVGAPQGGDDSCQGQGGGEVHLFEASGADDWVASAKLEASRPSPGDGFGSALDLDAGVLAVGAPGEDSAATWVGGDQRDEALTDSGAVYLFERRASSEWAPRDFVKAPTQLAQGAFGLPVVLLGDELVVGRSGELFVTRLTR